MAGKSRLKIKSPSQIILLSIAVFAGIFVGSSFAFGRPLNPSPITNGITLFGFGLILLLELYFKPPFRFSFKLKTPEQKGVAAIAIPIALLSIVMAFLIGFEVQLSELFKLLIGILYLLNTIFIILLSRI